MQLEVYVEALMDGSSWFPGTCMWRLVDGYWGLKVEVQIV